MKKLFVFFFVFTSAFSTTEASPCRGEFSSTSSQQLKEVKKRVTKANRPSFAKAREIVQRKGVQSLRELWDRRKTDPELQLIPSNPHRAYKDEGWVDRYNFFGIPRRLSFTEAKEIVQRKGIKSGIELRERRKTDPELQPIPSDPRVYKNEGWVDWYDFLGKKAVNRRVQRVKRVTKANRPSLAEAKGIVQRKGVQSLRELWDRRKTDPELQLIPSMPHRDYKDEGWVDRYDFFGIPRRLSFTEAKEIVQRKGIKSGTELRERRKTDPELQPIPGHPDQAYKHEGWTNRHDFFGTEP